MSFDSDFIDKVREANNIVDIISEWTQLKGRGGQHMGLCPFPGHSEKTPSFSVSEDKQLYHCFGCKKSGNIYNFIQEMKGLSFPEAVEYLAQRASLPIPESAKKANNSSHSRDRQKLQWKLNKYAAQYFQKNLEKLSDNHQVIQYCEQRGLTEEIRSIFEIGYATDDWEGLVNSLQRSKAPLDMAATLGLIKQRNRGRSGYFDLFRGRLMFPIRSHTGNYIGFGGRILSEGSPKYLNSPDSEVFNKGRIFYGLNETAKFIRSMDSAIVVEGYMDLLALYRFGFKNVVATLGTALTAQHAKLLKRYTQNVYVLFDSDEAGFDAAKRSLPLLLQEGLMPRHVLLPEGKDPDEFLRIKGAEDMKTQLAQAPELFVSILRQISQNFGGSLSDKVQLMNKLAPILNATADPQLKDLYVEWVSDRLQVERRWVWRALKEKAKETTSRSAGPSTPNKEQLTKAPNGSNHQHLQDTQSGELLQVKAKPPKSEQFLLNLALSKEEWLQKILESGAVERFQSREMQEIFSRMTQLYRQNTNKFDKLASLLASFVKPSHIVSQHLEPAWSQLGDEGGQKLIDDCVRKVQEADLRAQMRKKIADLRDQSSNEALEELEQIMNIQSSRKNLRKE